MANTDSVWEHYGRTDPYFGVFSHPRFREAGHPGPEREEFFRSGESYVENVLNTAGTFFPGLAPQRALDFGCGVGRLTIPLARRTPAAVGIDISESMVAEARRNCSEAGITNAEFVVGDDGLTKLEGRFDLVHSFIVFQHIPVGRGLDLFQRLLDRLSEGGAGIVHFTFANANPGWRRGMYHVRKWVPGLHWAVEYARGRKPGPLMELNCYPLNALFTILQEADCHEVSVRFSNHGDYYGALLFFRRTRLPPF